MRKSRTTSKQLNLKLLLSGLFLFVVVCYSSLVHASSLTVTSPQEETINVPLTRWNELKGNLIQADASIESSTNSLKQADSLTMTQATELKELRIINSERAKALTELRAINEKQGQELAKASNKITEQEQSLTLASNSLDELKNEVKNNRRTEQRLRRQRDTWAAGGVIGFLIGAAGAIR